MPTCKLGVVGHCSWFLGRSGGAGSLDSGYSPFGYVKALMHTETCIASSKCTADGLLVGTVGFVCYCPVIMYFSACLTFCSVSKRVRSGPFSHHDRAVQQVLLHCTFQTVVGPRAVACLDHVQRDGHEHQIRNCINAFWGCGPHV